MSEPQFKKAKFVRETAPKGEIEVHFNPESLQYQVSNTLDKGKGDKKKQFVSQSTGKLTIEVVFDTTHDGRDVRSHTQQLARFMEPGKKKIPAIVRFEWGVYTFKGMLEAFKETIDFFDPQGVPLRSTVNLTLAKQDKVFESAATAQKADTQASLKPEPVQMPAPRKGPTDAASRAGAPGAARAIAELNGEASLRFSAGASLTVDGSIELAGPAAFASGGAGLGIGGGAGISGGIGGAIGGGAGISGGIGGAAGISGGIGGGGGISGGIGGAAGFSGGLGGGAGIYGGASAGLTAGGGGGGGISGGAAAGAVAGGGAAFGSGASAGVSASAGAFAGLRPPTPSRRSLQKVSVERLIERPSAATAGADSRAGFELGGAASAGGSASLKADVGADARLSARIRFEEE